MKKVVCTYETTNFKLEVISKARKSKLTDKQLISKLIKERVAKEKFLESHTLGRKNSGAGMNLLVDYDEEDREYLSKVFGKNKLAQIVREVIDEEYIKSVTKK